MTFHPGRMIRSLVILVLGIAVGAAGGAMASRKLHALPRRWSEADGMPGSRPPAAPEIQPDKEGDRSGGGTDAVASPGPDPSGSPKLTDPDMVPDEPLNPLEESLLDLQGTSATEDGLFFGFPVGVAGRTTGVASVTTFRRLRLMKDRCVGGFDGTSSILDFSGWTQALTGELTYENGRLAETAKGFVTADASTLDTGDADRDKEIRESLLEAAKFPQMRFDVSSLRMTAIDRIDLSGAMEIHGRTKDLTIPCSFKMRRDGYVYVAGEIRVKMTEFGIRPPVKLGIIKVADEVRIWFLIWAEPVKESAK